MKTKNKKKKTAARNKGRKHHFIEKEKVNIEEVKLFKSAFQESLDLIFYLNFIII